jgi:hypothetical protein
MMKMTRGEASNLSPPQAGLQAIKIADAAAASVRTELPVPVPASGRAS